MHIYKGYVSLVLTYVRHDSYTYSHMCGICGCDMCGICVPGYVHRKVVFICLVGSVNSVLKFLGQPGETRFQPGGDEISSGVPMTFSTKLTKPKGK